MTPWGPLVSDRGREEGVRPWLSGLATQAGACGKLGRPMRRARARKCEGGARSRGLGRAAAVGCAKEALFHFLLLV
jgi:hypothetical protein